MKLSHCLHLLPLLLIFGIYCTEIIEDEHQGPMLLPRFTWLDNRNIQVSFPNGFEDTIKLRTADKIGNLIVPCLYEGVLLQDNSSSVAVSGCQQDEVVYIVIYSSYLPNHNSFNINKGATEEVEKINFDESNTNVLRKSKRRLKKRGAYVDDYDYDEIDYDGSEIPEPPPFLSLEVKVAFEDSLLAEKKTENAAREYIARVFTLGKHHFQHTSLGTKIRLRAQGPIRRIPGKSWNPSAEDLEESKQFKDPENIPITYFCYNQDRDNDVGIAYIRRACHEEKGVAIVAARADINKAAQSYSHETGHWLGLPHDIDAGVECEGQGLMSRINTPGGRPSKWSHCNERKFNKWYYHSNKKFSKCLKEDEEVLQMENSCLATSYETVVTSNPKCDTVIVSGADYASCNGEYHISLEKVPWSPSKPVYAHTILDRYIYWNVRGHGWSIGNKTDLQTGAYFHYSGLDSSEPWEASWRNAVSLQCKGNRVEEVEDKHTGDIENGFGSKEWQDGSLYMGECKKGQRDGSGTYIASDGVKYIGEWKEDKRNGQGTNTLPGGDKYMGEYKDDKRYGQGTYTYSSGNQYIGGWMNDNKHGQGTQTWSNGDKYVGEYKDGIKHGEGIYTWADGQEYIGGYKDGKRYGQGKMIYPTGATYVGEYKDGKMHGNGTYIYSSGGQYTGGWKDESKHGQGTETWPDGDKYVGEHKDGVKHGEGIYTWADGQEYIGGYKDGERYGQGKMIYPSGATYVGEYKDGKMHGNGTYIYSSGGQYIGGWMNDNKHGQGTQTWPDGDKYVGEFKDGIKHGQGIYTWADGQEYIGGYKDGKRYGQGKMTYPTGETWTGMWVNGNKQ